MNSRNRVVTRSNAGKSSSVTVNTALRRRLRGKPIEGSILDLDIDNYVATRLQGYYRPNGFRYGDYLHVSDLLHKCVRMVALSNLHDVKIVGNTLYDNDEIAFAIGHSIQEYLTSKLKKTSPTKLYGRWSCACGKCSTETTYDRAIESGTCQHCDTLLDRYNELFLPNEEYGISGSIDIALQEDGHLYVVESKSIKKEDFEGLVRPLPDHVLQTTFYWWLAKENKRPIVNQASIVYTNKAYARASPFKEFIIKPQDYVSRLGDYLEDAKSYKESLKGGPLPVRTCPSVTSPVAKKCALCALCFGVT